MNDKNNPFGYDKNDVMSPIDGDEFGITDPQTLIANPSLHLKRLAMLHPQPIPKVRTFFWDCFLDANYSGTKRFEQIPHITRKITHIVTNVVSSGVTLKSLQVGNVENIIDYVNGIDLRSFAAPSGEFGIPISITLDTILAGMRICVIVNNDKTIQSRELIKGSIVNGQPAWKLGELVADPVIRFLGYEAD
jgi:hypothetical protein